MSSERIIQLLAKKMGSSASEKEIIELQQLLQQFPEHNFLIEILASVEGEKFHSEPKLEEEHLVQESWLMLQKELNNSETINRKRANENDTVIRKIPALMWMRRAAVWAAVLIIGGSSFFIWKQKGRQDQPVIAKINKVTLPYGLHVKKVLPDSSVVWLNSGSHIQYSDNFIQKNRDVYLDGEAYFSVTHDASHPFIVHAGNITVSALGTRFNVQAYNNENKVEATLISGEIMVKIDGKPDQSIILMPNEKLTVTNKKYGLPEKNRVTAESFQVQKVSPIPSINSVAEVAWLQDKLAFQNEPFAELAKRMERRYNIHIIFKDTLLENQILTGVFENENIEKALNLLKMTTPFQYSVKGDSVYLNSNH